MRANQPHSEQNADHTVPQHWERYTPEDHAIWRELYERQSKLLPGRACKEFVDGFQGLALDEGGIPRFDQFSERLYKATRWQVVAVPGLIPDDVFFRHLANRRFPVTFWIRTREQMDYLQEPDIFHDFFGHVPMLMNPVFADYMEAYGKGGVKALELGALKNLARLYWYTVEFGLINNPEGLRIYGAGIVSSKGESIFCLDDPAPNRIGFDLMRIMQTNYRIDDYQETYFVVNSFEQLFDATRPDFSAYYEKLGTLPELKAGDVLPSDTIFNRGIGRK